MKKSVSILVCFVLAATVLLSGCGSNKSKSGGYLKLPEGDVFVDYVLEVDGEKIPFDVFRYCYLNSKAAFSEEIPNLDLKKKENQKLILDDAVEQIRFFKAVHNIAEKYNITLPPEKLKEIDDVMRETFNTTGSAEEYKKLLKENFLTQSAYDYIIKTNTLHDILVKELVGMSKKANKIVVNEKDILDYYNKNYYRLASIGFVVTTTTEKGEPLKDEIVKKNVKETSNKAKEAYNKLKTRSFESVMRDYISDKEAKENINMYYPVKELSDSLKYKVSDLKVNETSELISSGFSYVILKRYENDLEYIKKNLMGEAKEVYINNVFSKTMDDAMNAVKVVKLKNFDKITTETLK